VPNVRAKDMMGQENTVPRKINGVEGAAGDVMQSGGPGVIESWGNATSIWGLLSNFAGMYRHESVAVTTIQQVNDWHLVNGFITGYLDGGWAFHAGGQLALTAQANNGDGKTLITCAGHGLVNGDVISISNTTSYDGVWVVEQVIPPNTFVIPTVWVANEGAKTAEHGSHFISASALSAGKYLIQYTMSITPAAANCRVEVTYYCNATQEIKSESRTKLGAIGDYQNVVGFSICDIATSDVISLAIRNVTDAGDFTIRDGNMTLIRIG